MSIRLYRDLEAAQACLPDGVFVSAGGYEAEQKLRKVHFPAHPSTPEALAADLSADRAELEEKTDGC